MIRRYCLSSQNSHPRGCGLNPYWSCPELFNQQTLTAEGWNGNSWQAMDLRHPLPGEAGKVTDP